MKHIGDITKINGAEIEPVWCITGGSPCQDLSVAGKRAGLAGARSGLFMDQIRIVKEMRSVERCIAGTDERVRLPRFMVWENVPGAFSSNGGADFSAVLEEVVRVAEPAFSLPRLPERQKWTKAGAIVGDGWSVAWRTHDARWFGVAQRRRRIALVADFDGHAAGDAIFERVRAAGEPGGGEAEYGAGAQCGQEILVVGKGGTGHPEPGCEARESAAGTAEESAGADGVYPPQLLKIRSGCDGGGKGALIQTDVSATLACANEQTLFQPIALDARNLTGNEEVSGTIQSKPNGGQSLRSYHSNAWKSGNPNSGVWEADVTKTLDNAGCGYPACNQGGTAVVECCQNTGRGWWNRGETAETIRTPCGGDSAKANLAVFVDTSHADDVARVDSVAGAIQQRDSRGANW